MTLFRLAANYLRATNNAVNVSNATPPTVGQQLTATSPSTATWQTGATATYGKSVFLLNPTNGAYTLNTYAANSSVTAKINLVQLPFDIIVNQISFEFTTVTDPGSLRWGLYSADGQTQITSILISSVAGVGAKTYNASSVLLSAGTYYQAICPLEANVQVRSVSANSTLFPTSVVGKPKYWGSTSVVAGALPATINPTTLAVDANNTITVRLDN